MLDLETFNCCGCASCANICPVNAIKMVEDKDGFYIPSVDKGKCTNCDLCRKICPQLNDVAKNTKNPKCYATMASDEVRQKSSSGGAFSVIAHEIFNRGGVVCGAAFDENWTVKHIIIENEDDMDKLRGSKYVQSFISETLYKKIKEYLKQDRWVLFVGTPCQVSGLKAFLGNENFDKLLKVDLVCSKVPPKKHFDKFLKDNYSDKVITDIKMRDKVNGWGCNHTTTTTTGILKTNSWFKMFLNSLSMNESCVYCKYMTVDRVSDITIGDFWGIEKVRPDLNDKKGTSCVLINTKLGKQIFDKLDWSKRELMTVQNAVDGNRALFIPFIPHTNRVFFAEKINENIENFNTIVEDCLSIKKNVGILNWWWNSNRGAILTCYAIQEVVKELGFNPTVIKHIPFDYYSREYKNSVSEHFAEKYLNLTEWCHSRIDMRKQNDKFETFMVGSDQIWNHDLNYFLQDFYYLNFAQIDKNLISCAASFGKNFFTGNPIVSKMVEYYLKRFNHISVREEDGVELLKNKFDTDGTFILDPVFLIDKEKYSQIANEYATDEDNFIACYFIHPTQLKTEILNMLSDYFKIKIIDMRAKDVGVEKWLYCIKNAKFIISDSFHASAFSVIFNKKFVTLYTAPKIDSRFDTLANITGLHKHFMHISDFSIKKIENLLYENSWEEIEAKLQPYKEFSLNWLKNALETPGSKEITKEQEYIEAFYASLDDRVNYLEGNYVELDSLKKNIEELKLQNNKAEIYINYYKYKILKVFINKKQYKQKASFYHEKVRKLRQRKSY